MQRRGATEFESHLYGIETGVPHASESVDASLNRTFMELKQGLYLDNMT